MKSYFKRIFPLFFFIFCSCESSLILPSTIKTKDRVFFEARRTQDLDRQEILKKSHIIYFEEKLCSKENSCREICDNIFVLDFDRKDCKKLSIPQVHQFEVLSHHILKQDLKFLQEINMFDLKVFLNLSPEPLYRSLRTLDLFFVKQFFGFLAIDWQFAQIVSEEDWDFLFLNFFLNENELSPINLLKEKVSENKTFIELAWYNQNDPALFWLDDYFEKIQCEGFMAEELENCVLAQYCHISDNLDSSILKEFVSFKKLQDRLSNLQSLPKTDLQNICLVFCSSEKGQNHCQ